MSAFSVAWQLLKSRYSEKDILDFKEKLRREAESGYASDRGRTSIEHLMGMRELGQQSLFDNVRNLDYNDTVRERKKFEREYKDRMDPKPISQPTKVRLTGGVNNLKTQLVDDDNNIFSTLGGTARGMGPQDFEMTGISGDTRPEHQRQGHYGNLMNTLLQHGIGIHSDNRNRMSQPFHRKFQQNLAPNINFSGIDENYGDTEIIGDVGDNDYSYSRKPNIESPEGWGSLQPDYGQYPLVNEAQLRESREPYKETRQSKLTEEQFNPIQETNKLPTEKFNPLPSITYEKLMELFG